LIVLNGRLAHQIDVGAAYTKPPLKNRSRFSCGTVVDGKKILGTFIRLEEFLKREEGMKPVALMGEDEILPIVHAQREAFFKGLLISRHMILQRKSHKRKERVIILYLHGFLVPLHGAADSSVAFLDGTVNQV
jgi:hypothetical protein